MTSSPSKIALAALALALGLLPMMPRQAHADAQQTQSFTVWRQMQDCAQAAALRFPDHTPQANTNREAARQECLRLRHLPVTGATVPVTSITR